ncbi:MAG: acyltransferase [Bacteroidales bacterium]|jgi:1-acyl-sn-glycerol-3-phosphate acyltransferase|nr:acyltransferase [Bacteroidales bacterium]
MNKKTPRDISSIWDDIRPFRDDEIPDAMHRIAEDKDFPKVIEYLYGPDCIEEKIKEFSAYKSVYEFQSKFMSEAIKTIARKTTTGFTFDGFKNLEKGKGYLFVSNHRDILLDAALLQIALYDEGLDCSEITFGDNLMQPGIVTDLGKSNRMFKVIRRGTSKDFFKTSLHLSSYIRYVLTERNTSVWIAQRNGRTKDGDDKTSQTVLKMFSLSGDRNIGTNFSALNIVPMAISYEWETCITQKVRELYLSQEHPYIKEKGEDFRSIMEGILSPKGKVHIQICEPISAEELLAAGSLDRNEALSYIASVIDNRIYNGYKLFSTNYIAYDMLYNTFRFTDKYTKEEYKHFADVMHATLSRWKESILPLMNLYLKVYSNPVVNKLSL